ncbi:MAG TPA: hypothetical protein PKW98_12490 [Candidatus Wallbacteria bacterium]|nr:MAG: hypothetical protein BWY32_03291 [bacterium ADurb.Bin243]HOD42346.1 hypothetical protein [Candidatus Wallbacteria bacterium]HPG58627.1 hypothetical protein [Candidatus Wallbacteria bacterium]
MNDFIRNNSRAIINLGAALIIAALFALAYRYETGSLDFIAVSFEKPFKLSDGFTFRVTNNSDMDLNSVKMTVGPKRAPEDDFVCYPRRVLFRNGFTLHDTSDFADAKGSRFEPKKGAAVEIIIECRGADGRLYSGKGVVEYR